MMRREQMQSLKIRKPVLVAESIGGAELSSLGDLFISMPDTNTRFDNGKGTTGVKKYTDLRAPVRAIFAVPHDLGPAVGACIGRLQTLGPATKLPR
jgi:hypothetical protein